MVNVDVNSLDFDTIMDSVNVDNSPVSLLINIIFMVIGAGYTKYVLNFIRTGKFDSNEIIECLKTKWLNLLCVAILYSIIVGIGTALLIIPGIIAILGLSMSMFITIDTDLGPIDALKKSWEMMKGNKWNYFVFALSFLGWILLTPFTLFLLLIWLSPYMHVASALYYENLKKN